ncbi:MAG: hypothetical protein HY263_00315 [Chloroflexi bacterium]|nr:hypothetical protein [Chloroflexota bacterium]
MSVRVADPHATSAAPEIDLLARLGLRPGASNDQVEAAHDEILDYLQRAPGSLRDWVRARTFEVDEAYGILNGATQAPAARPAPAPLPSAPAKPAFAAPPTGAAQVRVRSNGSDDALGGDLLDGWPDELDAPAVVTRRDRHGIKVSQQRGGRQTSPGSLQAGAPGEVTISRRALRNLGLGGGLIVALAVGAFAIFQLGKPSVPGINGTPAPGASAAVLDTAAVAADMAKLQSNPNDVATLQDLANLYYAVGDYATATTWLDKILKIDPRNIAALLGYGAAAYNQDDNATAEARWKAVVAIDPKNIEAHYDLGFLYFSQTPPNIDGVKAEWNAVLALNPDADLKSYIQAHLASLDALASGLQSAAPSGAPTGSAAPSGSPAPAASPAPATSPAASPAAS